MLCSILLAYYLPTTSLLQRPTRLREVRKLKTSNQTCYFPKELKWITIKVEAYDLLFIAQQQRKLHEEMKNKQRPQRFVKSFNFFQCSIWRRSFFHYSASICNVTYGASLVMITIHKLVVFMAGLFGRCNFVDKLAKRVTATLLYIWQLEQFVL